MTSTHSVGDRTEGMVLARLLQVYESVLIPFGNGRRYDLVVEDGGKFVRIQCKTGRFRNGAVIFNAYSVSYVSGRSESGARRSRGYHGEADIIAVYCSATDKVYMVPVEGTNRGAVSLRVDPVKNGQAQGIRWARDYELHLPP